MGFSCLLHGHDDRIRGDRWSLYLECRDCGRRSRGITVRPVAPPVSPPGPAPLFLVLEMGWERRTDDREDHAAARRGTGCRFCARQASRGLTSTSRARSTSACLSVRAATASANCPIAVNSVFTSAADVRDREPQSSEPDDFKAQRGPLYLRPSGSREHVATLVTLNPIVRVARVPLHPRERFRVRTAAVGARRCRRVSGRRGNWVRGRNETEARSFHDALQWLVYS